jgi:alkylation response protein AidB-like acyl-CoA dehydrogenase
MRGIPQLRDHGFTIAMLDRARIAIVSLAIEAGHAAIDFPTKYVKKRETFEVP